MLAGGDVRGKKIRWADTHHPALSEYAEEYRGMVTFWKLDRAKGRIDPAAPPSSSIKSFVPPVLGRGVIGQFVTVASPGPGMILAWIASVSIVVGLFFHRRAYQPLVDAEREETP